MMLSGRSFVQMLELLSQSGLERDNRAISFAIPCCDG